ncbi:hypothetical protein BV25DRAFT_1823434 [Artomyces pyxidatus]|uniref:Uncharacterized protein n=1 Tax=Artomyces pyxidatus TaxID=48021 RepID=A0ACB8T6P2_9AGAM|nr:hypothetical protein BV25DRAFT_1823434 [Artomyces pyxidatus]
MLPLTCSSFGDIVTAADLALRIFKALSDSSGSSFEYQCLVAELNSMFQVLKLVDFAVRSTPLRPDVVEGINAESARTRVLLERFWERIKGYQKSLGTGGSGSSWRKIGWGLFKTDEITAFRTKLAAHRETIASFLMSSVLGTVAQVADEIRQNQVSIKVSMNQILTTLRQPPRYVGADAVDLAANPIAAVDPIKGRLLGSPTTPLCFSWEQLDPASKPRADDITEDVDNEPYGVAYDVW